MASQYLREQVLLRPGDDGWIIVFPTAGSTPRQWDVVIDLPHRMELAEADAWFSDELDRHGSLEAVARHHTDSIDQRDLDEFEWLK